MKTGLGKLLMPTFTGEQRSWLSVRLTPAERVVSGSPLKGAEQRSAPLYEIHNFVSSPWMGEVRWG